MHESEQRGKLLLNGKKISDERLAQLLHIDKQKITMAITTFLELGVARLCPETGALMNKRMVRDDELISKKRDCGKLGGNPSFFKGKANPYYNQTDKQKDNQKITTTDKQKITPSYSSSFSTSTSVEFKEDFQKIENQEPQQTEVVFYKTDEEWLDAIKKLPQYSHVDFEKEIIAMFNWLESDKNIFNRKFSQEFVLNWLNRVHRPLKIKKPDKNQEGSTWLRKKLAEQKEKEGGE